MAATDRSDGADRAVDIAADMTVAAGGELLILHVASDLSDEAREELRRSPALEQHVGDAIEARSTRILTRACERARQKGVQEVHTRQAWGDTAETIMHFAQREKADALVIGRRGRGRLAGLLLGSASQKLASLAPCIVIIVP